MQKPPPYVSFVIAGRNDDYGGDFNDRLSNSVTQLSYWLEKYQVPSEFIVVNYNPVVDKRSLLEAIKWRENRKYLTFRIITVSQDVHRVNENPEVRKQLPFYEYLAKNTGIRRARGEFICAVNPDIIYHPGIIKWLSERRVDKEHYYRTDRCDFIKPAAPPPDNAAEFLEWLSPSIFRLYLMGNHYDYKLPTSIVLPFLRFYNKYLLKLELFFAENPKWAKPFRWNLNFHNAEYRYHCNVSGDFMLMHRDKWFALNGYPENTYLALHTDALFVVVAGTSGLKETVFKYPIYHQDHERRYNMQKDEHVPMLRNAYLFFQDEAQKMIKEKHHKMYNPSNWGLADYHLDEIEF